MVTPQDLRGQIYEFNCFGILASEQSLGVLRAGMITGLFFIIVQYLCRASFLILHKPKVNVFAESYGKISTTSDFLPAFRNNGLFAEIFQPMAMLTVHLFPDLRPFWFLEKTALCENCVSGTVLMFQLTRNSLTNIS